MHHLFPAVPFYRYNDAWRASRHLLDERNLVWQTLFGWAQTPRTFTAHDAGNGLTRRARISAVESVAEEVRYYELSPIGSARFPGFSAGAHIDVEIAKGLVRQYSLCGSPECPDRYRIAVRRDPAGRGGSQRLHESFVVGHELWISEPRNHFPLDESGSGYFLVAGGIGITPLLAMSLALEAMGKSHVLHVCARNAAALPFGEMLGSPPWTSRTHVHLDDGADSDQFSAALVPSWRYGMQLYLCGPREFMAWVITLARSRGWPDSAIRTETFSGPAVDPAPRKSFEVVLRKTGRRLNVPADKTLLEVLQTEGLPAVASCTQGLCGACRVNVLEGDVDHRDRFFSDDERRTCGQMTVCVSRAGGATLVLDL
jgi:vanillate O-demethylase ferredoxin subunit